VAAAAAADTAAAHLDHGSAAHGIVDRDWQLTSVGDLVNPRGAGDQPITLRFDTAANRAAGFAGCNRYAAGFALVGDSLRFQAPISTRMACDRGMDVETAYLQVLERVLAFAATDSTLTLTGASGTLAQFRAPR
ncbi:MAG: META domain-containing protein, partial [Gemmatimonadales bacterium]